MINYIFFGLLLQVCFWFFLPNTALLAQNSWVNFQQEGLVGYYPEKRELVTSGEPFHDDLLEGAHARIPYGAMVEITNLSNKKTVIIRINDRIFKKNYLIGLTKAAAEKLGISENSTAKVSFKVIELDKKREGIDKEKETYLKNLHNQIENEIEKMADSIIAQEKKNSEEVSDSDVLKKVRNTSGIYNKDGKNIKVVGFFGIQIGNFQTLEAAIKRIDEFEEKKLLAEIYIQTYTENKKMHYRVLVGKQKDKKACYPFLSKVIKVGFKDAFVRKY